jgi:chromosome segregation ATPase
MADTANDSNKPGNSGEGSTPPWGDDFDAERAWRLVQNLKSERDGLRSEVADLKTERDNLKTEAGSETDKVKAAQKDADDVRRELWIERALRKHPEIDEDYIDFLSGDTEDEINAKAERLAKIGKKAEAPKDDEKDGGKDADDSDDSGDDDEDLPGKPKPDLKPGHGGDSPESTDPAAIALEVRGNSF